MTKLKPTILQVTAVILLAAFVRLLPHPPNFTPVGAMALLGGIFLPGIVFPLLVPVMAVFLSDLFIGFHDTMSFVYLGIVLTALVGKWVSKFSWLKTMAASLLASVIFYVITNLGVWLAGGLYEQSISGLLTCYIAAVPFFHYSLLGDVFFTGVLGGIIVYTAPLFQKSAINS